ncbi:copper amine oxidase N-terminal domain-containing protein [Paenibacillus wulumuqiensis]|uniref:copper amine oxidase N-terminal domain-containing protein n=1 Tax=Paenibacillus wulumuqiensis TaxID=1567107 RepID=UPI000619AB45|nr:copper amine oxidase N-terminal domain-containing protein [Paenibacillus wulumuqiensis]
MKRKLWITLPLVLLLIVLSGCQAVGNLDIKNAMIRNLDVKSMESSQTLSVQLTPSSTASADDIKMATILNSLQLNIDSAKLQADGKISVKGAVQYSGQQLPYHLYLDDKGMTIDLQGAKQPIYISFALNDSMTGLSGLSGSFATTSLQGEEQEFAKQIISFLYTHLPNPSDISVSSVQQEVYGENLDLTQLHVELTGQELITLVKPFLSSISQDEQGMRQLIGTFYDFMASTLKKAGDQSSLDSMGSREKFVNNGYKEISKMLTLALKEYDSQLAELQESPEFNTVFGPNTRVSTDVYFDKDMYIRKQSMELTIALPDTEYTPFSSIRITTASESWNINGNVTADPVDTAGGVLQVSEKTTPGTFLRNFEETSPLYMLLNNMNGITEKTAYFGDYGDHDDIITRNRVTLVPAKDLAEALDAKMEWNASAKQLTLTDDITGAVTVLKLNSNQAVVDGQTQTLSSKVINVKGKVYVPLRSVAGILGATVTSEGNGFTVHRK